MRLLWMVLFMIPAAGLAQDFRLIPPDTKTIREELQRNNYSQDVIYIYLCQNYATASEKYDIQTSSFGEERLCAFKQKFESKITYSLEQCTENGGKNINAVFPKTDKRSIVNWVESIYKSAPMGNIKHEWNSDLTEFGPTDNGAGCYFTILYHSKTVEIKVHCGC
ncbi:hypothetical protein FUAX_04850 [Fulvitalea axinellae]|uniref:Uncharacterized protein n=1 Tax=Fulvitalea axinellae TaxID=1182444 RepID=A0AAU9CE28_9BACT|nr:hypothetical protein FUAX_04850 [Fulvitalea axinellae]